MFSYILISIIPIPLGYNTKVIIPINMIKDNIVKNSKNYEIEVSLIGYKEGSKFFEKNRVINENSKGFIEIEIEDQSKISDKSGYAELNIKSSNKTNIFLSRAALNFYTFYYYNGKKSFLSDNAYKFGSPTIIAQMAKIKKYIDAYPAIMINKINDLDETIVLINPYKRKIKAKIITFDGREINNIIINSFSVKEILLSQILQDNENEWKGHIQLTATNRIITFNYKHSFKDKKIISDFEHLDPYRGDPTFIPFTKLLRQKIGTYLSQIKY